VIKEARWSGWVWVGECFFWYQPTWVVPDQRPLNGRCCCLITCISHSNWRCQLTEADLYNGCKTCGWGLSHSNWHGTIMYSWKCKLALKKVKFSHTRYRALARTWSRCTGSQPAGDVKWITLVVTHQLQVEHRTGKVRRPETDVLPLCHATNLALMTAN